MKKIKSYTSIWSVEKVLYAISDVTLPFPVTFTQMAWFIASLLFVIMFSDFPPLCFMENVLIKYFGIPIGTAWFMSQKTFDGKRPYSFLKSAILYFVRPKITYAGKPVKLEKRHLINESVTAVRSELYE